MTEMESKSKKEAVLVVDKEKEYDFDLAEARKRLAMIRYEIFSEKYCPSPITRKTAEAKRRHSMTQDTLNSLLYS